MKSRPSATRLDPGERLRFVDYDRDGHLDLFVANYVNFDLKTTPLAGKNAYCRDFGLSVGCGPQGMGGGTNILYRNRGDGTFEDVSLESGIAVPRGPSGAVLCERPMDSDGFLGLGVSAADFDNDGWPDIYVACDSVPSRFYHNKGTVPSRRLDGRSVAR